MSFFVYTMHTLNSRENWLFFWSGDQWRWSIIFCYSLVTLTQEVKKKRMFNKYSSILKSHRHIREVTSEFVEKKAIVRTQVEIEANGLIT